MTASMRGWLVWGGLVFFAGCSGRVDISSPEASSSGGTVGTGVAGASVRPSAGGSSGTPGSASAFGGRTASSGPVSPRDAGVGTGMLPDGGDRDGGSEPEDASTPVDGGEPTDASVGGSSTIEDAGTDASVVDGHDLHDTSAVVNAAPDQTPSADSCGGCGATEVCHPGVGCEPACDLATGLDPNAAWPAGGGCATRRGLSRFSGPKSAEVAFTLDLMQAPASYSSAITLGPNREIYIPSCGQYCDAHGFLRIAKDGSNDLFDDWLGEVPVLAQNGNLYTVPTSLFAQDRAGNVLWSTPGAAGSPLRIRPQMGEPVVGADGTIYAPGIIHDGAPDQSTGLIAVNPGVSLLWGISTGLNVGLETWPAVALDGTIYFGAADGALWAASAQGKKKWSVPLGAYGWGYPAVDHAQNVFAGNGPNFWSFTPDGQKRFEVTMPASGGDDYFVFQHLAIGPDGTIFAAYYEQTSSTGQLVSGLVAFSNSGVQLWRKTYLGYDVSPPIVDRDGTVFVIAGGTLFALTTSGSELWSQVLGNLCGGGLAIAADGTLLAECTGTLTGIRTASQSQ